ncbi:3-hydroxyacyl-CoA dehydrogenase [Mycobacterium sp. 852013-50091_SCH5140682]|uniref:3-hydroxyacyl-CoA dehydrogenase n=1 Tax=Mycobacterium sp. 852013-50091_SCH5140682 TaxID=1834109 RepID=UPI000B1E7F70|nr:3-hydroxyacyl-CoA dehydrogenase [Mycobacterium sp. 852013-50091_SCH5140682]
MSPHTPDVAVLGAGSIGVSFAILFAGKGSQVRVYDPVATAQQRFEAELARRLEQLHAFGRIAQPPRAVADRIRFTTDLPDALSDVGFVQECAPERTDIKRPLLHQAASYTAGDIPIVSSTSAIVPTELGAGLPDDVTQRILVGHPGNPPYLLPVIEIVPSAVTAPAIVDRVVAVYRSVGLRPVLVRREVEGFIFNRLQGALLREAYCLLRDGVATVDDIDEVVRAGLGRRWSVIGPFETADLNTRGGLQSHAEKMGPAYQRMGAERGQHDPWTPDLVAGATAQRRQILDLADWDERVQWRDEQLMRLQAVWDDA